LCHRGILDRDGEDPVDDVHLEVFDVPVSVPATAKLIVTNAGTTQAACAGVDRSAGWWP